MVVVRGQCLQTQPQTDYRSSTGEFKIWMHLHVDLNAQVPKRIWYDLGFKLEFLLVTCPPEFPKDSLARYLGY